MEESFPRGGKRSQSAKNDSDAPSSKRKKFSTSATENGKKKLSKKRSKRGSSPDQLAALWTGKLTPEVCVSDLLALGCVRTVLEDSILLELPDGLRCLLSLTNISFIFTEQLLRQHRSSESDQPIDNIRLRDYFTPGQLLCCRIIPSQSTIKAAKKKKRRERLAVTIDPAQVNSGLSLAAITEGMVLNGAVRSVEEKGYLIDLGLGSSSPGSIGFLPFDQCRNHGQAGDEGKRLRIGQVLLCAVTDAPSKEDASQRRVVQLSTLPNHLNGGSEFLEKHIRKEQYSPGLVVKAVVDKVLPSRGLIVRLAKSGGGCWRGFVSKWKLQHRGTQPTDYKPQQSLKVAILYTITNSTVFGLSAESHLTSRAADEGGRLDLLDAVQVGDVADGRVIAATPKGVVFFELIAARKKLPIFAKATRLQLEMTENDEEVESRYSVGSKHRFRVTGYSLVDRLFFADTRKKTFKQPIVDVESCVPGTLVEAKVWKAINEQGVFVRLYDRINGYVPLLHCHDRPLGSSKKLDQKFTPGKVIKARILYSDAEKNRIVLTTKKKLVSSTLPTINSFDPIFTGDQADGFIVQINAERGLLVAFYGKARGWLPKVELEKCGLVVNQKLSEAFYLGQVIRVKIREVDRTRERMLLSAVTTTTTATDGTEKESAIIPPREIKRELSFTRKTGSVAIGKIYTAVITKIQKLQLDILIEDRHQGRVFATEISDNFTSGSVPVADFCVGQAILVKVIAIRLKRYKSKKKRKIVKRSDIEALGAEELEQKKKFHFAECTMKASKIKAKSAKKRVIGYKDEFKKGEQVAAIIEEFTKKDGVLHSCRVVVNPNWKGDVPILQLSTDTELLNDPIDHFPPGQVVMARVTGLQAAEKHLQFTCLPSKMTTVALGVRTKAMVVTIDEATDIKCRLIDGSYGFIWKEELGGSIDVGQILEVRPVGKQLGGKWRVTTKADFPVMKTPKDEPTFESIVSKKPSLEEDVKPILTDAARKMKQAAGFSWDSGRFSMANLMNLCLDDQVDEQDGEEKQAKGKNSKQLPKSKFARERLEEDELLQKEMSLLDPDRQLASSDDFDRLVMGSPDSSLVWIRYMAFFLQRGDVAKAKAVAERALKTISVREDNERFNVWIALLNLENAYGTSDSFRQAFERGLTVNDPLKIYQLGTKILRKSNKIEECDKLFDEMLSKFKPEFNVWVSMGDYYMATSRADKARDLMRRAMKSLPQARHVDLISRFAQMEYRHSKDAETTTAVGDPERGRTLFENILRDCPKRTDVWSVYIDMTSKYQNMDEARPIFERVTSLKLNSHNMRLFYKKWLALEERLGTPETLAQVKKRASEYVQESLAMLPESAAMDQELEDLDDASAAVDFTD